MHVDGSARSLRAASLALCVFATLLVAGSSSRAQTPPRTLSNIPRVTSSGGPFRIWTYDSGAVSERTGTATSPGIFHGVAHPFTTWTIGSHTVNGHIETWTGCSVPGRPGTFDVRRMTAHIDPYLDLVTHEVRPNFAAGSGVAVHRFRWVQRLDPVLEGIADGEARVMLPATGCVYVRDAVHNLTRTMADSALGGELGLRPYWRDGLDPTAGFYFNRLNTADVISVHAFDQLGDPSWGLGVYALDLENADSGNLIIGSNQDAASRPSLEFGYDVVFPYDHVENNGVPGEWIQVNSVLLRSLPSVTPKEYAWWENVDFVKTQLLLPFRWVRTPSPLSSSPAWSKTAVVGVGYGVGTTQQARTEADRIRSFFSKYDRHRYGIPDYHYVPSFNSWTDELYSTPMRPAFADLMRRVRRFPARIRNRAHVLTYLATGFYSSTSPEPPHPLAGARAHNDDYRPYAGQGINWFVDSSDPAFVAAFDQAVQTLRTEGVEGVYFDNLFGELLRNYNQHEGADPSNHLDQVTLVDRTRDVLLWDALFIGEQSRLGNRYAAGAFLPCGFRAVPGGSAIPFVDALIHEHRLTVGAGDLLEQWFAHVKFGVRGVPNPTKRDVQNIVHDYMFGFVKGQLVLDGRTEYEVDPGGVNPTVKIQIFEADPALHPVWADPLEVLGFEVLKDVADRVYPRMMWWRSQTPALQEGRMLRPPYPTARLAGRAVDEWFVLQKEYFFKFGGFSAPPGATSDYETERFPVSFWALPGDPDRLTLFMGNPTYDPALLTFDFSTADYPSEMGGSRWNVTLDANPENGPDAAPSRVLRRAKAFRFTVLVMPLSFRRLTFTRR